MRDAFVALGLAFGPAVALGLARFAYALLLPAMRSALNWSFALAGAMNTANSVGYLIGALTAAMLSRRFGPKLVFVTSMAATGIFLLASAATENTLILLSLRALAGISGAACFVIGGALAAQLGYGKPSNRSALLLGIYFGGGGLGVVVSGVVIPPLLAALGPVTGWRWGWVMLAAVTAISLIAAVPAAKRAPMPAVPAGKTKFRLRAIGSTIVAYTIYGAGYISYMTFIIAYLKVAGAGTAKVSTFWAVLGLAAIAGGFVWGPMLARLRGGRAVAILMAVVTCGALAPLITRSSAFEFSSAFLFGISFLAVVTAVTTVAKTVLRPDQWTSAIATLTTGFALGQCIGPLLSGILSDSADGVRTGLLFSVLILVLGAVVSAFQPGHVPSQDDNRHETGSINTRSEVSS